MWSTIRFIEHTNHILGFVCWDVHNESDYKFSSFKFYFAIVIIPLKALQHNGHRIGLFCFAWEILRYVNKHNSNTRKEEKPSVPCRKFTACKRTQKWRGSRHFRQNSPQFLAHSFTFRYWGSLASFQTLETPCGGGWNVLNHWSSRLGVRRATGNGTL